MTNGVIVIIYDIARQFFKKSAKGKESAPTEAVTKKMADKIGMKKFLSQRYPMGIFQNYFCRIYAIRGISWCRSRRVLVGDYCINGLFSHSNKPKVFLDEWNVCCLRWVH